MKRPHPFATPNGLRKTRSKQRLEPLPALPANPKEVALFLQHIVETLIGHSVHYINTPWGSAADLAYDDVAPIRDAAVLYGY